MSSPPPTEPENAQTVADFAASLGALREKADMSLRDVQEWGQRNGAPIPRSTLQDVLSGKRLPRKQLLFAFLAACGVDSARDTRWVTAWSRLNQRSRQSIARPARAEPGDELVQVLSNLEELAARTTDPPPGLLEGLERAKELAARAAQARPIQSPRNTHRRRQHPGQADQEEARRVGLPARLINDVRASGLRRIGTTYLSNFEWRELFTDTRELDVFVAYGQTWRNMHARELARLAQRSDSHIRVFLPDPDHHPTVVTLAERFAITPQELIERIDATRRDYMAMRRHDGGQIDVYYGPGDRMFSFFRLDDTVIVGFYSHSRTRLASIPVFVCGAPGELFDFITEEISVIQQQSRLV